MVGWFKLTAVRSSVQPLRALRLLAYRTAGQRRLNFDRPRNLDETVTVA
jgi:glucosamine 6-phosphate synthetase-like amidotransferase/phosphosugar isomerase protein